MATRETQQETQIVDALLDRGRRRLLTLGGAALAGLAVGPGLQAQAQSTTSYSDNDILNFALNLEFLEANFYYLAAFGCTIDKPNAAAIAAGAPTTGIPITGSAGTAGTVSGGSLVPFTTIAASAYAVETAIEEGKHVLALQSALGSSAIAQPAINLGTAWQKLAVAAGLANPAFTPYASDASFLLGAFVFEDVGVSAYTGAASLLTSASNLQVAAGLLSVEAYHAGLIRTALTVLDPTGSLGLITATGQIATLRATLSAAAAGSTASTYDKQPDDFGLAATNVSLAGGGSVAAARIADADATTSIAFARGTEQVINIVTGGGAGSGSTSPALGLFFPAGLNGLFK